jgi:hypothetical protein
LSKLPAFQFYPGDWRKDMGVQSLNYHDRGVWWEMLCLMHESERRGVLVLNGQAMGEDSLSRLLGLDKQILTTTLTNLLTSGVASREDGTGAIYSRRMVNDEYIRKVRSEAGSKGGNPRLLKQIPTTGVKQIPTPSARKMKIEDEDVLRKENIDASMLASGVLLELNLAGRDLRMALEEIGRNEEKRGGDLEKLKDRMVSAYRRLLQEAPTLDHAPWGPLNFFSGGHWEHPENWRHKNGTPQKIRLHRLGDEI